MDNFRGMSGDNMMFAESGNDEHAANDMMVANIVHTILQHHYPNHPWCVGVDHKAGTCVIDLLYSKPIKFRYFAYLLHLSTLMSPNNTRAVVRAGGELLERFNIPRDAASPEARMRILTGQNTFDGSNPDE